MSDASGMQLLDIKNRCWSDEVVEKLGVDIDLLPKVCESTEITGYYKGIPLPQAAETMRARRWAAE